MQLVMPGPLGSGVVVHILGLLELALRSMLSPVSERLLPMSCNC